jgi:hypothetical protein
MIAIIVKSRREEEGGGSGVAGRYGQLLGWLID